MGLFFRKAGNNKAIKDKANIAKKKAQGKASQDINGIVKAGDDTKEEKREKKEKKEETERARGTEKSQEKDKKKS